MSAPITYVPEWLAERDALFESLWNGLDWVRHDKVPRREYYVNTLGVDYSYGQAAYARTYKSQAFHPAIAIIKGYLEFEFGTQYEAIFLNGYGDGTDFLGWHADDSPEMDDRRSIAIVSLGAEREIWFRPNPATWTDPTVPITKLLLGHGSLCLMGPGMQDEYQHRIPKAGFVCGPRISLTFRGYVK